MGSFVLSLTLAASLLSTRVVAQGGDGRTGFDAPPLQHANLAFYAFFTIAGLFQIVIAVSYLFRGRSPHLFPGVAGLAVLLFLVLSNGISVASTIARFTYDANHDLALSPQSIVSFSQGAQFFDDWTDSLMFFTISLILRDRYITSVRHLPLQSPSTPLASNRATYFSLAMGLIIVPLFITATVSTVLWGSLYTSLYNLQISQADFDAKMWVVDSYRHAFVGVDVMATILLLSFAVIVRGKTKLDKIAYFTLYFIMPLICLHTIARIIFEILDDRLPRLPSYTTQTADTLDFSSTVVYHTLFFVITCFLSYFFIHPRLWNHNSQGGRYPSRSTSDHSHTLRNSQASSQMTVQSSIPHLSRSEARSESALPGDPPGCSRVITIPMEQMPTATRKISGD